MDAALGYSAYEDIDRVKFSSSLDAPRVSNFHFGDLYFSTSLRITSVGIDIIVIAS
jgi:hypothetical protein